MNSRGAFGGNVSACLLIAGFAVFCEVRCPRLCPADAIGLAVLFPTLPGEEPLVGVPLTLPMWWVESPLAFCAATETAADPADWMLQG